MSPEHAIQSVNPVIEQLLPQISRCVDEYPGAVIAFNDDGNTRSTIARFIGVAITPVVADPWHASRRAGAEHDQLQNLALLNRRLKFAVV